MCNFIYLIYWNYTHYEIAFRFITVKVVGRIMRMIDGVVMWIIMSKEDNLNCLKNLWVQ